MHIVTGGAGFIGSAMIWKMNQMGIDDIVIVDDLGSDAKWKNLRRLRFFDIIPPSAFLQLAAQNQGLPDNTKSVLHFGACSSTTEANADYLLHNNYRFSKDLAVLCLNNDRGIRFINSSSAATYGNGEYGYADGIHNLDKLLPMNMYGHSKLMFDQWAARSDLLKRFASVRFFNVYGPNEYHKGEMASMVYKSFGKVKETGRLALFKSHRADYGDGEQQRDFVYVKDVVDCLWWLLENPKVNGILNLGTGEEASWNRLAKALFKAMGKKAAIDFIDMPDNIRGQYQYHTRADISRLRKAGYKGVFRPVETGVEDYVKRYLTKENPYLGNEE